MSRSGRFTPCYRSNGTLYVAKRRVPALPGIEPLYSSPLSVTVLTELCHYYYYYSLQMGPIGGHALFLCCCRYPTVDLCISVSGLEKRVHRKLQLIAYGTQKSSPFAGLAVTTRSRVNLKLIVAQLLSKFPTSYGTRRFITARHWTLLSLVHPGHTPTSSLSNILLPCLTSSVFCSRFFANTFHAFVYLLCPVTLITFCQVFLCGVLLLLSEI